MNEKIQTTTDWLILITGLVIAYTVAYFGTKSYRREKKNSDHLFINLSLIKRYAFQIIASNIAFLLIMFATMVAIVYF